jgi:hypothetical protein
MAGKASGRCRSAEGVYGRFSASWQGRWAATSWRDGQTTHEPSERARWALEERGGYLWCLPPSMAERAASEPDWIPPWPFDLLPIAEKERLVAEALAAGLPAPGVIPPWPPASWTKSKK